MRKYTDLESVEDYIGFDVENSFTGRIDVWIEQMSEYIETQTGRVFEAEAENTERIYEIKLGRNVDVAGSVSSPRELVVDEFVNTSTASITITIDDEVVTDDYLLYPVNETPKNRIRLTEGSGLVFTEGEQNIKVEARWGYSETIPSEIVFVATVLVAGIIQKNLSTEGELKSVTLGAYSMTFKDERQLEDFERVQEILIKYAKPSI